jgi:hypothetical protein
MNCATTILDDGGALLLLLAGRIAALGGSAQGLGAQLARRFQIENWIEAKGVLARLAVVAIAHGKGSGPTRLDDQIESRQQSVRSALGASFALQPWPARRSSPPQVPML